MDFFSEIEDAVIAKLNTITGIKTVESYSGQLAASDWKTLIVRFPCIYCYISSADFSEENTMDWGDVSVNLLIGDRNLRGPAAARRGDSLSPGVYAILQDARDLLHNQKIIDGFNLMKIKRAAAEVYMPQDGLCIWSAAFQIKGSI